MELQIALKQLEQDYYSNSQNFDLYSSLDEYVEMNIDELLGLQEEIMEQVEVYVVEVKKWN